jgi:hypothetical protein
LKYIIRLSRNTERKGKNTTGYFSVSVTELMPTGSASAKAAYSSTPVPQPSVSRTHARRTIVGSTPSHSPIPPLEAGIVVVWKKYQVFSKAAEILLEKMKKVFEK